jgi:hypothetical protein
MREEVTPKFGRFGEEILYPQIQGVTHEEHYQTHDLELAALVHALKI